MNCARDTVSDLDVQLRDVIFYMSIREVQQILPISTKDGFTHRSRLTHQRYLSLLCSQPCYKTTKRLIALSFATQREQFEQRRLGVAPVHLVETAISPLFRLFGAER